MGKYVIVKDSKKGIASEYFCWGCGQLRLSLIDDKTSCANCGSDDIERGIPGTLNKTELKREFQQRNYDDERP